MKINSRIVAAALTATATCVGCIASFEGFSGVAYKDIAGIWTYAFGETSGVKEGMTITKEEGYALLQRSVQKHEKGMYCIKDVPLYQYEYDADVSLAYNIGVSAFCHSSVARLQKQGKYEEACNAFLKWDKARVKGKLKSVKGLRIRRQQERLMCLGKNQ